MTRLPETPVAIDVAPNGEIELYALTGDGITSLGRHATPASAWQAIDAIDLADMPLAA